MTKSTVSISKCNSYMLSEITGALDDVLKPLGGMEAFVQPGDSVLIKVNLLRALAPEKAATTHPALIEAVINAVRAAGGVPVVGESPGGPNTPKWISRIVEATGAADVCRRTNTELVIFDRDTTIIKCTDSKMLTMFKTGHVVNEVDTIITLPKLKTHSYMKLTGAVKLLFGMVPGLDKVQLHQVMSNRMDFANMLLDIYQAIKPALSIMDAVVAMEGDGPSGGIPKRIGALVAGADSIAIDFVASEIIGVNPLEIYTNLAAVERGLISGINDIDIVGAPVSAVKPVSFKMPTGDFSDAMQRGLLKALVNIGLSKPYLAYPAKCSACGICKQSCPGGAITITNKRPLFNYNKCIHCYCCEELCQELAIKRKNHWLLRPFVHK